MYWVGDKSGYCGLIMMIIIFCCRLPKIDHNVGGEYTCVFLSTPEVNKTIKVNSKYCVRERAVVIQSGSTSDEDRSVNAVFETSAFRRCRCFAQLIQAANSQKEHLHV